jgi:hypothetical protein
LCPSSGGSILATLLNSDKPAVKSLRISALVRSEEQAKHLTKIGVTPIFFTDLNDVGVIQKAASEHDGEYWSIPFCTTRESSSETYIQLLSTQLMASIRPPQ